MTSVFVSVLRMYLFTAIFCLMEIHVLRIIVNPQINYDLQTQLDNLGKLLSRQKLSLCFLEAFLHVKKLIELKFKSKDKNNTLRIDQVDNKKNPHKAGLRTRDSFFSVRQKFYFFNCPFHSWFIENILDDFICCIYKSRSRMQKIMLFFIFSFT